jgi:hypothetical protein
VLDADLSTWSIANEVLQALEGYASDRANQYRAATDHRGRP